jgi:hypothetical protein
MAKTKNKHRHDPVPEIPQQIQEYADSTADVAYGTQLADVRGEIRGAESHTATINRAYDAYAKQLGKLGAAQQAAQQQAMGQIGDVGVALQGVSQNVTADQVAQAQKQAAILGQGSTVSDTAAALGGATQGVVGGDALNAITGTANVGLANYSDLERRGATGERDRIRAKDDLQDHIAELTKEKRQIRKEKGAFEASTIYDQLAQRRQEAIALLGIQRQKKNDKMDQQLAEAQLALDASNIATDNELAAQVAQDNRRDDRHDNQAQDEQAADEAQHGGMSQAERQQYHSYVDKINAGQQRMDELITNRGMSIAEARRRAKSQLGLEEWQIRAASQLVRDGSLSGGIQQGVQAHLPGNHLPPTW